MVRIVLIIAFVLNATITVAQTVYRTPSGRKYHTATCRYVKNVSHRLTVAEARRAGLSPCTQCRPDQHITDNRSSTTLGIKQGEAKGQRMTSVQCKGTTKAGARCRRMTKNVNGYCFQHEG